MHRIIDSGSRNELKTKGYACPQCGKTFTMLEADIIMDFSLGIFVCDVCRAEVSDNDNIENSKGNQDRMQRFYFQMRFILEGLRKTEDMVLPAFDPVIWIRDNLQDASHAKLEASMGDGLKIAGSTPGQNKDDGIGVVMSMDKDEATRRQERAEEAEAKRQQNLMPSWHLKSTISGDLTALGIAESARAADANPTNGSSNEELLRSLGSARTAQPKQVQQLVEIREEVKPVITQQQQDSDTLERYYASLTGNQQTPIIENAGSEFGEEEEDVKPSVEYLNSLGEYRKRSRSIGDVGMALPGTPKRVKSEHGNSPAAMLLEPNMPEPSPSQSMDVDLPLALADDPEVMVNGEKMRFSEVTEEHQEMMTPEEYTEYFKVFEIQNPS